MTTIQRGTSLLKPDIISPPKDTLILLTNTLGTSSNWLVLKYLCRLLGGAAALSWRRPTEKHGELSAHTVWSSIWAGGDGVVEEMNVELAELA